MAFYNGVVIPEFLAVFLFFGLQCALAPVSRGADFGNACVQMRIVCVFGYARVGWPLSHLSRLVCGNAVLACWGLRFVTPSLQALRAETLVERFTARMHVWLVETVCSSVQAIFL